MAATRSGRLVLVLLDSVFFRFYIWLIYDNQGGVCSLLRRLSLDIDEQSIRPEAQEEGSSIDSLSTSTSSVLFLFVLR